MSHAARPGWPLRAGSPRRDRPGRQAAGGGLQEEAAARGGRSSIRGGSTRNGGGRRFRGSISSSSLRAGSGLSFSATSLRAAGSGRTGYRGDCEGMGASANAPDIYNSMYAELHAHSNFSLLDGASFPEEPRRGRAQKGMAALALTDHDGLYAAPRFCRAAKSAGIKPISGRGGHPGRGQPPDAPRPRRGGLRKLKRTDNEGAAWGIKGVAQARCGPFRAPSRGAYLPFGVRKRRDTFACQGGQAHRCRGRSEALHVIFGPDYFFIEVQHHLEPGGARLCRRLCDLACDIGVPAVATNNVHYAARAGHRLADVLACIRNRVSLDDSAPFRRPNSEYYLKGYDEMRQLPGLPVDAIRRTVAVAESCAFDLDFSSYSLPAFDLPPGETAPAFLRRLCLERVPQKYAEVPAEAATRLEQELALIEQQRDVRLFPHRPGHHGVRPQKQHPGAGARLRRRLARRLSPWHHPRRSHQARPFRRQVLKRVVGRPRHRHRYRHAAARRGDPVRLPEVRRGARSHGLHLRDVPGAQRDTGGGQGVRPAFTRPRQDGKIRLRLQCGLPP